MQDSRSQPEVSRARRRVSSRLDASAFDLLTLSPMFFLHQNKAAAIRILRSRLMDRCRQIRNDEIQAQRRSSIRGTSKSDRVRTYNHQQVSPLYKTSFFFLSRLARVPSRTERLMVLSLTRRLLPPSSLLFSGSSDGSSNQSFGFIDIRRTRRDRTGDDPHGAG